MLLSTDITIAGGGPAGLGLAAELAHLGLPVVVVDKCPETTWPRSYGCWAHDVDGLALESAVAARYPRPLVTTDRQRFELDAAYLRFDTASLQKLLLDKARRAGVRILSGQVEAIERGRDRTLVSLRGSEAQSIASRLLVDARGASAEVQRRQDTGPRAFQSAYGEWIQVDRSHFAAGEMDLMDYRKVHDDDVPSFLYAMEERPGLLFVQETVLASRHPHSMGEMKVRLLRRLQARGIPYRTSGRVEHCIIPMGVSLPSRDNAHLPYGAAAGLVHPATGYQLARALGWASGVAEAIRAGLESGRGPEAAARTALDALWSRKRRQCWALYESGLDTILSFDRQRTVEFVESFFSLPTLQWLQFMEGRLSPSQITSTMWKLFLHAPGGLRLQLLKSGTQSSPRALSHAFS